MTQRQLIITYSYHFLSEALIAFLAIIPILHIYFDKVPYGMFLIIAFSFTIVFAVMTRWTTHYGPFLLMGPVMFGVFYLVNFHWVVSAVLAIFFAWRYITLRANENPKNESVYLRWALILSIVSALIVDDAKLIIYLACLFIVLIVGYMSRNLVALDRSKEDSFNPLYWIYLSLSLAVGTGLIYILFPTVRFLIGTVWQGFIYGIIFIGSQVVRLLAQLKIFDADFSQENGAHQELGEADDYHEEPLQVADSMMFEWMIKGLFWSVIAAIVAFLLWRAYQIFKQRFATPEISGSNVTIAHESARGERKQHGNLMNRILERFRQAPKHPIRKLVYDLERKVAGTTFERKTYETVENWLNRLQVTADFDAYQEVRYGLKKTTNMNTVEFKEEISKVEKVLENSKNN